MESLLLRLDQAEARLNEIEEGDQWIPVGESSGEVAKEDQEGRRALAREIGRFLRRGADGVHRGTSGRDRLKLANRCYLVIKDFGGRTLSHPLFFESFQEVRELCKRGSDLGDSLFIGLPSKWEARVACEEGGFPLPASLRNA